MISTKVDALDGDYSGARVRASVRESMDRLGIGALPIVFLHDPEFHPYEVITEPGGAVDALVGSAMPATSVTSASPAATLGRSAATSISVFSKRS